jgi:hypothetical protein
MTLLQHVQEGVCQAYRNNGRTIDLNLSPQFEEYVRTHRKPMLAVRKRIHRELSRLNLSRMPMLLVLETTDDAARPHLHGVFILGGADLAAVKHALRRAVGWIEGKAGSRQIKSVQINQPTGWADYICKNLRQTGKNLLVESERELVWMSQSLSQAARERYELTRAGRLVPSNLSTMPASTAI